MKMGPKITFPRPRWFSSRRNHGSVTPSHPTTNPSTSKTWETTVTSMPSWPQEPKPLKKHTRLSYLFLIGDIVLLLLPVYFILLAVAVVVLNGKPTEHNTFGPKVESAMDLGPTIFPIVFAAICGRSLKMIARYMAERGTKLGTLELLMASQSVWGTVESQLLLQRLTIVGVNLLFLWTLSPLGGQASLRLMTREHRGTESTTKLRYMSTGPASTLMGLATTYVDNGKFADAAALYSAALMAPEAGKLSHQDPWGNLKIPILTSLNLSGPMTGEWKDVPSSIQTPEAYSSLVGLPVVGLPHNESSSFMIETTYLVVDCEPFEKSPYPSNITATLQRTNYTRLEQLVPGQVWSDKSINNDPFKPQERITSFFIDTDRPTYGSANDTEGVLTARLDAFLGNQNNTVLHNGNDTVREARKLLFASVYPRGDKEDGQFDLNVARCSISQAHVEVGVHCQGTVCSADKMRRSLSDSRPANYTGLEHQLITYGLAQNFPLAVATGVHASSATERFLANSSSYPFVQNVFSKSRESYVDLSAVPKKTLSSRLGLLLNTYYQLSTQPLGYFGSLSRNISLYGPDVLPATDVDAYLPANLSSVNTTFVDLWGSFEARVQGSQAPFIGATTTANVTTTEEVFVCNFAWFSLLVAASIVILTTGIVALILKRMTLGPEFFGPVASMTYENPFVKIPEGGSTLDAMERARIMRDVEVYVADVAGEKTVGHVAFAAGVPLRKLERSRTYA